MDEEKLPDNLTQRTDSIIKKHESKENELIQILLDLQEEFNWIPKESMKQISESLGIPISRIFRVGSFYKAMNLRPLGDHLIQVCLGTACVVRGSEKISEKVQNFLGIEGEGTTPDLKFTFRRVNCLGCCAMGPVMVIDGDYYGHMTTGKVNDILEDYD